MNLEEIIPYQIPAEILIDKRYDDIILYALSAFGPLERSEFINSRDNSINNRMNKNTFYKWVKELRGSNYIVVEKDERRSVYSITELGLDELLRRLKRYHLDFDTINEIEQQRIQRYINSIKQFFTKYEIHNEDIKAEFIEIANEITRDKLNFFPEIKFNKLLLFICLNHPKFYQIYTISEKEFISKYNLITDSQNEELTITDINMFLQRIFEEKIYGDKIYRLILENNGDSLYFKVNGEYGSLLQTILKSKFKYLYNLNSLEIIELNNSWLENAYEDILNILIDKLKYFNEDLRESLKTLIKEFTSKLVEKIKKNPVVDRDIFSYYSLTNILDSKEEYLSQRIDIKQKKELEKQLIEVEGKLKKNPLEHENLLLKSELLHKLKKEKEAWIIINEVLKLKPPNISKYLKTKAMILHDKEIVEIVGNLIKFQGKKEGIRFFIASAKYIYRKSLKLINKAIKMDENSQFLPLYYQIKADLLSSLQKDEEALSSINKAIELKNNFITSKKDELIGYANAYKLKAIILHNLKKVAQSKNLIKKAKKEGNLQISDEIDYYIGILDYKQVVSLLDKLIKDNPENLSNYEDKALYLAIDQKFEESNKVLDFLLEKDESNESFLKRKFNNYLILDDYDNALILIDRAYKKSPSERRQKYEELVRIYDSKKNYMEGLYVLNKLLELNISKDALIRYLRRKSKFLIKLEKFEESLQIQNDLINNSSTDDKEIANIKAEKAIVLAKLGRKENGINLIESLLSSNSEEEDFLLYCYGKVLIALSAYEGAIIKFQEALKVNPDNIHNYLKIAKCYKKLKDSKSALDNLNKAKSIAEERIKKEIKFNSYLNKLIEKIDKRIAELNI